ncbi:MAG: hypothetical protein V1781_05050 [Bacteroidota bacterium]
MAGLTRHQSIISSRQDAKPQRMAGLTRHLFYFRIVIATAKQEAISNLPVPTCLRADAQAEHGRQVAKTFICIFETALMNNETMKQ